MFKKIIVMHFYMASSILYAGSMGNLSSCPPDWSGFYVGINLGDIWSQSTGSITTAAIPNHPSSSQPFNANKNAFIGGGQLGYNGQLNRWILGTEVSFNGMTLNKSHTLTASEIPANPAWDYTADDIFSQNISWQVEWVGRLGLPVHRTLLYGLAGIAVTQSTLKSTIISVTQSNIVYPATFGSDSKVLVGGAVGAGADYAVASNIQLGIEYRYSFYGNQSYPLGLNAVGPVGVPYVYSPVNGKMNLNTNQVVLRLNYQI